MTYIRFIVSSVLLINVWRNRIKDTNENLEIRGKLVVNLLVNLETKETGMTLFFPSFQ